MKNLFWVVIVTLFISTSAFSSDFERVILNDSKNITVEINGENLRCSIVGYGQSELKVSLKELDGWTILDHTNAFFGEVGAPCMSAGYCKGIFRENDGFDLEEILRTSSGKTSSVVNRKVIEKRFLTGAGENQVCHRQISEVLDAKIIGIDFHHERSFSQEFSPEFCNVKQ